MKPDEHAPGQRRWKHGRWYHGRRRVAVPVSRRLAVAAALVATLLACGGALWPLAHMALPRSGVPVNTAPVTVPVPVPSPASSPSPSPAVSARSGTASPTPSPGRPVSYEAEAATIEGSARVSDYPGASGGQIVRNIGTWNSRGRIGALRFTVIAQAEGRYSLTFFYVYLDEDTERSIVITVSGAAPVTLAPKGGSSCCAAMATMVALRTGSNTITFANPAGPAPALDRIVIAPR